MKNLFLFLAFSFGLASHAQTDPELEEFIQQFENLTDSLGFDWDIADTVSMSLDQIRDTLFSDIDTNNYSTGRLFDRVMEPRDLITFFNGETLADTMNYYFWYGLHEQIRLSELMPSNLLTAEQNIIAGYDFINSIDIDKEIIEYPVGILLKSYNFWNFADNDQFEDGVTTSNYQIHESGNISNYIDTGFVFAVQPLIALNFEGEFYLTLPADFIISDSTITAIEVDYGFGYETLSSSTPLLVRATDSLTILNFRLALPSGKKLYCKSLIENENFTAVSRDHVNDHPDYKDWYELNGIKMKFGIYYACNQIRNEQTQKPVILIPGYQPAPVHRFLPSLYRQENHHGLLDDLRAQGHTVIVVTFWPGYKNIIDESYLVEQLINAINTLKMSDADELDFDTGTYVPGEASYYENVIIGYSAGGQAVRMALNRMEEDNLINGGPHHHSKLYVSFDSPHNGGNLVIADQCAALNLATVFPTTLSLVFAIPLNINLNTIAGQQLGRYSKTVDFFEGAHAERVNFMNLMYSYDHPKTDPTVPGFPTFTRNIAVVLGRYDGQTLPEYSAGDQMFGKITIATPFGLLNPFTPWGIITYERIRTWSAKNTSNHTVYKRYFSGTYYGIPVMAWADKKANNTYEFDNCAGSYRDDMHKITNSVIRSRPIPGIGINYLQDDNGNNHHICFIPSVSGLAINESLWGSDASFNFKEQLLLFNTFEQLTNPDFPNNQSNYFGYPHLGNPTNHFNKTPFEAFYINQENEKHIKTYDFDEAVTAVDLKFFLLDEIDPYIVVLQNYKMGWNTNSAQVYTAWYHGTGQVLIGNLVTPKTDPGDFIIEQNADVRVTSDNLIHMYSGFHAQAGCEFHAYIAQENCTNNHAPEYTDYYENEQRNQYLEDTHSNDNNEKPVQSENLAFQLTPNPTSGEFSLNSNITGRAEIYIFDLTGKLVFTSIVQEMTTSFNLTLENGVYLVRLNQEGKSSTQKLLIQH